MSDLYISKMLETLEQTIAMLDVQNESGLLTNEESDLVSSVYKAFRRTTGAHPKFIPVTSVDFEPSTEVAFNRFFDKLNDEQREGYNDILHEAEKLERSMGIRVLGTWVLYNCGEEAWRLWNTAMDTL